MRGTIPELSSPYPLGARLPALYATDALAQGLTSACDTVLAPVLGVLDMLDAYLDPRLAPPDFVQWLGSWLGENVSEAADARLRAAVAAAGAQLGRAGTARAIAAAVALAAGVEPSDVDVVDSGGTAWSRDPNAVPPGEPVPHLAVRVRAPGPVDPGTVEAAIVAAKPAHIRHTLSLVDDTEGGGR